MTNPLAAALQDHAYSTDLHDSETLAVSLSTALSLLAAHQEAAPEQGTTPISEIELCPHCEGLIDRSAAPAVAPSVPAGWREFVERVSKQKPEKPDYWSSCGQCEHNISEAEDLIDAAPAAPQAPTSPLTAEECADIAEAEAFSDANGAEGRLIAKEIAALIRQRAAVLGVAPQAPPQPHTLVSLPPLPEPSSRERIYAGHGNEEVIEQFDRHQMREYARSAVHEAEQAWQSLAAAPQAQAPSQPEPVAWRGVNSTPPGGWVLFQQYPQALVDLGKTVQPLYAAAPAPQAPLTTDAILDLAEVLRPVLKTAEDWALARKFGKSIMSAMGVQS